MDETSDQNRASTPCCLPTLGPIATYIALKRKHGLDHLIALRTHTHTLTHSLTPSPLYILFTRRSEHVQSLMWVLNITADAAKEVQKPRAHHRLLLGWCHHLRLLGKEVGSDEVRHDGLGALRAGQLQPGQSSSCGCTASKLSWICDTRI